LTRLAEPDDDTDEADEGEEAGGVLVEAGEDPPEMLELADETLDQVPLLIGGIVAWASHCAGLTRGDGGPCLQLLLDRGERGVRIVPPIGEHFLRPQAVEERDRLRVVARRATRQDETQRIPQRVDQDM